MKTLLAAALVTAAALAMGAPAFAQSAAAPAVLSLALASAAFAPVIHASARRPLARPAYADARVTLRGERLAAGPIDHFVSGSVQFDYGAAGLGRDVSTFGYALAF